MQIEYSKNKICELITLHYFFTLVVNLSIYIIDLKLFNFKKLFLQKLVKIKIFYI
jgi:hypothetical protein